MSSLRSLSAFQQKASDSRQTGGGGWGESWSPTLHPEHPSAWQGSSPPQPLGPSWPLLPRPTLPFFSTYYFLFFKKQTKSMTHTEYLAKHLYFLLHNMPLSDKLTKGRPTSCIILASSVGSHLLCYSCSSY